MQEPCGTSQGSLKYPQGDSNEPQKSREKQGFPAQRGTDSGTVTDAATLEALAAALAKLSPADRDRLAAMLLDTAKGQSEGNAG
jgi:hypothetical protein